MMKRILTILLAVNTCSLLYATDPKDGETRTASFTYQIGSGDLIDLQAKYTDVDIEAWDKNEVFIEATIRFDGRMTDKMQRFLDSFESEVESNISKAPGQLIIRTNLDEPNKFQLGGKHVGIQIGFNEDELKLKYSLKVPANNELNIENSYRDLYMTGDFRNVTIDQYSGDLVAESIEQADIKLKYGSASFEELKSAEMELYEQDLTVKRIGELEIETKYSELKIQELGSTEIVSYESDFEIGNLASLEGNLKYGKLEVTEMFSQGELTTYEFDIEAESIGSLTLENSKYGKTTAGTIDELQLKESYEDDFDFDLLGTLVVDESKYANYNIGELSDKLDIAYGYEGRVEIDALGKNATSIEVNGKYIETSIETGGVAYKLVADTKYGDINIDRASMNVTKYIKDGDLLEIEATSKASGSTRQVLIVIKGYEMDLELD